MAAHFFFNPSTFPTPRVQSFFCLCFVTWLSNAGTYKLRFPSAKESDSAINIPLKTTGILYKSLFFLLHVFLIMFAHTVANINYVYIHVLIHDLYVLISNCHRALKKTNDYPFVVATYPNNNMIRANNDALKKFNMAREISLLIW